jgi:hypothetical protein
MNSEKILYVFDMDDTLVQTPTLSEVVYVENGKIHTGDFVIDKVLNQVLQFSEKIYENKYSFTFKKEEDGKIFLLKDGLKLGVNFVVDVNNSDLKDNEKKEVLSKFTLYDKKLILKHFKEFFQTESTVGVKIKENVVKVYEKALNKMILTGRSKSILKGVEYILFNIVGLEKPNRGLFLYDYNKNGVKGFKAKVIIDSIDKYQWEEIKFFDDRQDWLDFAEEEVKKVYPDIKFQKYCIK